MRTAGIIHIGEAARWAGPATARLSGYPWNAVGGGIAGGVAVGLGFAAATLATGLGAPGWSFMPIVGVITPPAALVAVQMVRGALVRHFREKLIERGVDNPLPWRLDVQAEALVITTGSVVETASWSAVSEMFLIGPYWVLLIQGSPTFVAKRNFIGLEDERAFVRAVLEKLADASRARSGDAVRFAEGIG